MGQILRGVFSPGKLELFQRAGKGLIVVLKVSLPVVNSIPLVDVNERKA